MKSIFSAFFLVRRVPHVMLIILLILVSGLAEGIGVSALVPILSTLTGDFSNEEIPTPFNIFPELLLAIGIQPTFGMILGSMLCVILISFLLVHVQDRVVAFARFGFLNKIRDQADSAIFAARWEYITTLSSGDVTNKIIHESERGAEAIIAMISMFAVFVQLLIYGVFAFLLSWKMFLIALAALLFTSFTARRLIQAVRKLGQHSVNINTLYSRQLVDFMRGMKLLKATATNKQSETKLRKSNNIACNTMYDIAINQSKMRFELQSFISIAIVSILYVAVESLSIPISVLMVFLFIVIRLLPKFSTFQGMYHSYSSHSPSLYIVDDLIRDSEAMSEQFYNQGSIEFDSLHDSINLDDITYFYPQARKAAVSNLSMTINAKSFIALVGASGGGKSTVLDLIMGLIEPNQGKITVDGDVLANWDRQSYRKKIGFVSQDSVFFSGTLRENLCLDIDQECDESLVRDCLEISQIKKFVYDLPDGLNTEVGEAGIKLSGGQRQRLSIARALIRCPSILVLDEATSSLDSESELGFQKALESISHKYTLIIVAHRLSTVRKADSIYVLEDGHLVENGTYDSIISRGGPFTRLVQAQMLGES